jgi:hypothetical protein
MKFLVYKVLNVLNADSAKEMAHHIAAGFTVVAEGAMPTIGAGTVKEKRGGGKETAGKSLGRRPVRPATRANPRTAVRLASSKKRRAVGKPVGRQWRLDGDKAPK